MLISGWYPAGENDSTAVENEVAYSMYQRLELGWLIYNNLLAYAELVWIIDYYKKCWCDN